MTVKPLHRDDWTAELKRPLRTVKTRRDRDMANSGDFKEVDRFFTKNNAVMKLRAHKNPVNRFDLTPATSLISG